MFNIVAFLSGLIFGIGLILSRMADPAKVLNFLDITGNWDPSLAFVMIGAIAVGLVGFTLPENGRLHCLIHPSSFRPPPVSTSALSSVVPCSEQGGDWLESVPALRSSPSRQAWPRR